MGFELPIYVIDGNQPVSWEATDDGGSILKGWDFDKKKMTVGAASIDSITGVLNDESVRDNASFSESDVRVVTRGQFNAAVRRLQRRKT